MVIIQLLYALFFILVNISIYLYFAGSATRLIKWMLVASVFVTILHVSGIFDGYLFSFTEFYTVAVFSVGLVILHYMGKVMDAKRKGLADRTSVSPRNFQRYESVLFFIRDKVVYVMATTYQILAVFIAELRA